MPTIQAVLFDFGKVLTLPPDESVWERMRDILGLSEAALSHGYWSLRDDYDAGLLTGDTYWKSIAGRYLSTEDLTLLKGADVDLWTNMNEPMLRWVQHLHASGFRTGILSNMPDAMAEGLCNKFDWLANFHHTVWSHALKLRKPQPEIYTVAIEGLGVPADAILFIDDKEENTAAARRAGMQTIDYLDHNGFLREMDLRGYGYLLEPYRQGAATL